MELKPILEDVDSGLTDSELISKHNLSKEQVISIRKACDKVHQITQRILQKDRATQAMKPGGGAVSSFSPLYERFNIGAEERDQIESRAQLLRQALRKGAINMDEFSREIRLLVRDVLEKHLTK